jgi:predicted DNA-binding protein
MKKMEDKTLQRVNARLGYTQNAFLDDESKRTGISKSSLIQIAVEQYISQKQALNAMGDMSLMIEKLENIELAMKKK